MARQKKFDEERALESALQVFWLQGYEATSIQDLTRAMKINTGSLYNTFGHKEDIFLKALIKYDKEGRDTYLKSAASNPDPMAAIADFFDIVTTQTAADSDHKGCLVVNTAVNFTSYGSDVQNVITNALGQIETFFWTRLEQAKVMKLVAANLDTRSEAKSLLQKLVGIRVLARNSHSSFIGL